MREKRHERKCRGTSRDMGRDVENHIAEQEKARNHFRRGTEIKKDHFANAGKMISAEKTRKGVITGRIKTNRNGQNRGKTQTVRNFQELSENTD